MCGIRRYGIAAVSEIPGAGHDAPVGIVRGRGAETHGERCVSVLRHGGYDGDRGDQIEVANIPFQRIAADEEGIGEWEQVQKQKFWAGMIRHGVTMISVILFFLFILRPMVRWLTARQRESEIQPMLPRQVAGPQAEIPQLAFADESSDREKLIEMARADRERFARLVETWLK